MKSEVPVTPSEGMGQVIDLVIYIDKPTNGAPPTAVAIEVKVHPSSARSGQLAAQYLGLRQERPSNTQVCSLLVFPKETRMEMEVWPYLADDDRAGHITWDELFDCVPASQPVDGDDELLANLLKVAQATLPCIQPGPGKTPMTDERRVLHQEMRQAVTLTNKWLACEADQFAYCTWKPFFWRGPRLDQFYGGLWSADGTRLRGQYLDISALYVPVSTTEAGDKAPPPVLSEVTIGFTLEVKGGAKVYRPEFAAKLPDIIKGMPLALGRQPVKRGGLQVCDSFKPVVDAGGATVGGKPAAEVMAETVYAYAVAFREFLLKNVVWHQ